MHKIILILFFSGSFISIAQMVDKKNIWQELETRYITCKSPKCLNDLQTVTNIYSIGKDTSIGGKTYSKINDTIYYENGGSLFSSPGCIRQDGKKVYFRPNSLDEQLIYDFSLQTGSTFTTYSQEYTVSSIDNIELNGQNYLSMQLIDKDDTIAERNDTLNWIEDIGAKEGFLYPINAEGLLLCFYNLQGLVYLNSLGYDCKKMPTGIQSFLTTNQLMIYPNPAENIINIQNAEAFSSVELYDTYGRIVLKYKFEKVAGKTLNLSGLQKGMYWIKVNSNIKSLILY